MAKKALKKILVKEKKDMIAPELRQDDCPVTKPKHAGGRPIEWTDDLIKEEANALIEWAKLENSIVLAKFYGIRGYGYETASMMEGRSIEFCEAKRFAKAVIGSRREELALLGKIDPSIVKASMANYDRDHLETLKLMRMAMQVKAQGLNGESLTVQVLSFEGNDN